MQARKGDKNNMRRTEVCLDPSCVFACDSQNPLEIGWGVRVLL